MCDFSRHNPSFRKILASQIFPKASAERNLRPEERANRGAPIIKDMTSSMTEIKQLSTDLLFILCKKNGTYLAPTPPFLGLIILCSIPSSPCTSVNTLVRRTGFGNAAGFLAENGLLSPRKDPWEDSTEAPYSDDSDDSDADLENNPGKNLMHFEIQIPTRLLLTHSYTKPSFLL